MNLSILLPTVGRPTLARMLESIRRQELQPGDEVLLLMDDRYDEAVRMWNEYALPGRVIEVKDGPHRDWGHTPRNMHMKDAFTAAPADGSSDQLCRSGHLLHLDDDDVLTPYALTSIRKAVAGHPCTVGHMFRMLRWRDKRKFWTQEGKLKRMHISTQNFVHPNKPETFGTWGSYYGGDAEFIIGTAARCSSIAWHDIVTCIYGPDADMPLFRVWNHYAKFLADQTST